MSVWDDSWGACDARGVRGDRDTLETPNVRGPKVSHHLRATCRTTLAQIEGGGPMPTIVPAAPDRNDLDATVTGSSPTLPRLGEQ